MFVQPHMGKTVRAVLAFFISNAVVAFGASDTVATLLAVGSLIVELVGTYFNYRAYKSAQHKGMMSFDRYWC